MAAVLAKKKKRSKPRKSNAGFVKKWITSVKDFVMSTQGLPFTLVLTILCILFVLFRMKAIEQDYKYTHVQKRIEKEAIENKELKAQKARLLSVKNLKKMARRYKMKEPTNKQIIVIP